MNLSFIIKCFHLLFYMDKNSARIHLNTAYSLDKNPQHSK